MDTWGRNDVNSRAHVMCCGGRLLQVKDGMCAPYDRDGHLSASASLQRKSMRVVVAASIDVVEPARQERRRWM